MKITFAMIVFQSDFVLREVLESIMPYGKVVVVEGPVEYWHKKGYQTSFDETNKILKELNVETIHGQWKEKTEMCKAFMPHVEGDYLWCIDADEVFKPETIERVIATLKAEQPDTLGFRSTTFYGGFERIMGGFERKHNFKRILKLPGDYINHRPPTLSTEGNKHIKHYETMYHYSYVSPRQVSEKLRYYKDAVSMDNCKDNYMEEVFLPWQNDPVGTEFKHNGVHEFKTVQSLTEPFTGEHPQIIQDRLPALKKKFKRQLYNEIRLR